MTERERMSKTHEKLVKVALQLYDIRLASKLEPYYSAMLDTIRATVDECLALVL